MSPIPSQNLTEKGNLPLISSSDNAHVLQAEAQRDEITIQ